MKVDVTFVNFPASDTIRSLVAHKIESRVSKFSNKFAQARAYFTVDGFRHQVRLHVSGGEVNMTVTAVATDIGKSVDQAIDRLDSAMRKQSARRKHRRFEAEEPVFERAHAIRHWREDSLRYENAFDKYEEEFVEEFEEKFQRAV